MPFRSQKQAAWAHTPSGESALGGPAKVAEWDHATDFTTLPRKAPMANWIEKAVKHPGALSAAAKSHGKSKLQEAESEKHSSNPKIRARGALGERFIKGKI